MIVGFTGTRYAINGFQRGGVTSLLLMAGINALHHGCCQGADEAVHEIADSFGIPIVGHPPTGSYFRSKKFLNYAELRPAKPYLERNHDIVDESNVLIATPKEDEEVLRSGTWATIRYAREQGVRTYLILPGGKVVVDNL